ncbi:MAG: hypothetical protein ACYDD4_07765 [Acidimicrobiales bacterium]
MFNGGLARAVCGRLAVIGAIAGTATLGVATGPSGAAVPATAIISGSAYAQSLYVGGTPSTPWEMSPTTLTGYFPVSGALSTGQIVLQSWGGYVDDSQSMPIDVTFKGQIAGQATSGSCAGGIDRAGNAFFALSCSGTAGGSPVTFGLTVYGANPILLPGSQPFVGYYSTTS